MGEKGYIGFWVKKRYSWFNPVGWIVYVLNMCGFKFNSWNYYGFEFCSWLAIRNYVNGEPVGLDRVLWDKNVLFLKFFDESVMYDLFMDFYGES